MKWYVNVTLGSCIPGIYTWYDQRAIPIGRHDNLQTLFFLYLLFSHHDADPGFETLLPVTELSQPSCRSTVYSIIRTVRIIVLGEAECHYINVQQA